MQLLIEDVGKDDDDVSSADSSVLQNAQKLPSSDEEPSTSEFSFNAGATVTSTQKDDSSSSPLLISLGSVSPIPSFVRDFSASTTTSSALSSDDTLNETSPSLKQTLPYTTYGAPGAAYIHQGTCGHSRASKRQFKASKVHKVRCLQSINGRTCERIQLQLKKLKNKLIGSRDKFYISKIGTFCNKLEDDIADMLATL